MNYPIINPVAQLIEHSGIDAKFVGYFWGMAFG